jgi:hypothetical protein
MMAKQMAPYFLQEYVSSGKFWFFGVLGNAGTSSRLKVSVGSVGFAGVGHVQGAFYCNSAMILHHSMLQF